jgi:DTW domain-containing protein YfiP
MQPMLRCLCAALAPAVANRTEVVVLQHPRERFHPFGTARLLELGLARCRLEVAWGDRQGHVSHELALPAGTALLYPSPDARALETLPASEHPTTLLVLDGTWSQAHCLYRDNPWLQALPHVRLSPTEPSRYRIRKEPAAHCLSTLESTLLALGALEPDTRGCERLLAAFIGLVDGQAESDRKGSGPKRVKRPRQRASRKVAPLLHEAPERLVVAYGEPVELSGRRDPERGELAVWMAHRPATGETFHAVVHPSRHPPSTEHLARLELGPEAWAAALTPEAFLASWRAFMRDGDRLCVWNRSTVRLLREATGLEPEALQLKASYCNLRGGHAGSLSEVVAREGLQGPALGLPGRAARRLAQAVAVTHWLAQAGSPAAPAPRS